MAEEKSAFPKFNWKEFAAYWNELAAENGWPSRTESAVMQKYSSYSALRMNPSVEQVQFSKITEPLRPELEVANANTSDPDFTAEVNRHNCNAGPDERIIPVNEDQGHVGETSALSSKATADRRSFAARKYVNNEVKDKDDSDPISGEEKRRKSHLEETYEKIFHTTARTLTRMPIRVPKNVSKTEWRWCDEILSQWTGFNKSLKSINRAVYAIGAALVEIHKGDGEAKRKSDRKAYNKDIKTRETLIRYIGMISGEIDRRKVKAKPTQNQKKNLSTIRRVYKIKNTNALISRLENLKARLRLVQEKLKETVNEKERRTQRQQPIKNLLEGRKP